MRFTATMNTPGYSPWSDDTPPVFATACEAWAYLADERARAEDDAENANYSATFRTLTTLGDESHWQGDADKVARWVGIQGLAPDGTGVVYGHTPGYAGSHDLGVAYHVDVAEPLVDEIDASVFRPVYASGIDLFTPEPWEDGARYSMSQLREETWQRDAAPFAYRVPCTTWGDYCGDDIQRSNFRVLLDEYGDTFREVYGDFDSHYLVITADALVWEGPHTDEVSDVSETWHAVLTELAHDYPLWSDEDHGALIMELADEAWDAYLTMDVPRAIERELTSRGVDSDDAYDWTTDASDDWMRDTFYRHVSESDDRPYAETATDVVFPMYDAVIGKMADALMTRSLPWQQQD